MRLLPILWRNLPSAQDWQKLSAARVKIGFLEKIEPARALPGSPGRILCIGADPGWLCDYAKVEDTNDEQLAVALAWCLEVGGFNDYEPPSAEDLLGKWFGETVTYVGTEEFAV